MNHSSWNENFPDESFDSEFSFENSHLSPSSNKRVYVHDSFFSDLNGESQGGAIYFSSSSSSSKLLVESSSFHGCSTTTQAGAIFFFYEGSCIYSKVCGTSCSSSGNNWGKFDYIWVTNNINNPNYIKDSSICSSLSDSGYGIVCHLYGTCFVISMNSTDNRCSQVSSFYYCATSSAIFIMKHSSISGNNATIDRCFFFQNSAQFNVEFSNILFNKHPIGSSLGLIYSHGSFLLKECCIVGNEGNPIFHNAGTSFTINNCTIDESSLSKTSGSVSFTNQISSSFVHSLIHLSSGSCQAQYVTHPSIYSDFSNLLQICSHVSCCFNHIEQYSIIILLNFIINDS